VAEIKVRRATREDVVAFLGECRSSVEAFVALVDGKPVGLGGLLFDRGRVYAFSDLSEAVRKYPKTIHKTALAVMRAARAGGHRYVFATRDQNEPTALRWLARLGSGRSMAGRS
jgi:hypothetical protein